MEKSIISMLGQMPMSTFGLGADLNDSRKQLVVMLLFINVNIYLATLPFTSSVLFLSHLSAPQVVLLGAWMTFTFAHLMTAVSELYFISLMYTHTKLEQIKKR